MPRFCQWCRKPLPIDEKRLTCSVECGTKRLSAEKKAFTEMVGKGDDNLQQARRDSLISGSKRGKRFKARP